MAVELRRQCGYRKVGGLYLCGSGTSRTCDRLPLPLEPCPTCGEVARFNRGIAAIKPLELWDYHGEACQGPCSDVTRFRCPACRPPLRGYVMWVGEEYTPESFIEEARQMGVSKRVAGVPADLVLGEHWVFLAKLHLLPGDSQWKFAEADAGKRGWKPGVFYAFRPQRLELIITDEQAKNLEYVEGLIQRGITPIVVPASDEDHKPRRKGVKDGQASADDGSGE